MRVVPGVNLHLTYTYLWVFLGILWIVGVALGSLTLSIGEPRWWERMIVWFWPVCLPALLIYFIFRIIFWPEV